MKTKVNNFFKIFSGRPKNVGITESIRIVPFILIWILAIGFMIYGYNTRNFLYCFVSLVFAWQNGWGMSIERFHKADIETEDDKEDN